MTESRNRSMGRCAASMWKRKRDPVRRLSHTMEQKDFRKRVALESYKNSRQSRLSFANRSHCFSLFHLTLPNIPASFTMSQGLPSSQRDPYPVQRSQLQRCFSRMPIGEFPSSDDVRDWGEDFASNLVSPPYASRSIDTDINEPHRFYFVAINATNATPASRRCGKPRVCSSIAIWTCLGCRGEHR